MIVFFAKLIKILTGIVIIWLIFRWLQWLGGKKIMTHTNKQRDNSRKHRKFVESHVVEDSSQTDDKAQS